MQVGCRCRLVRGSGREKVDLRPGLRLGSGFAHLDHQAVGIGLQADGEIRGAVGFQHYTGYSGHGLGHADSLQQRVVHRNRPGRKSRGQRGVMQVEINSLWIRQAMGFVLDLVLHVNYDGAGIRGGPMPDAGDLRQHAGFFRSGGGRFALILFCCYCRRCWSNSWRSRSAHGRHDLRRSDGCSRASVGVVQVAGLG